MQDERVAVGVGEDRLVAAAGVELSTMKVTPLASSAVRAASTSSTWKAIGALFGWASGWPKALGSITASVSGPA